MSHPRPLLPQERPLVHAFKAALRGLHEGPLAIPRSVVIDHLGIHSSTYSRWCNPEEADLPTLLDLVRIVNVVQNPAPFRSLLRHCGEGYEIQIADESAALPMAGPRLLVEALGADAALESRLAQDLADGIQTPEEALATLPAALERLKQSQSTVDFLQRLSKNARKHA